MVMVLITTSEFLFEAAPAEVGMMPMKATISTSTKLLRERGNEAVFIMIELLGCHTLIMADIRRAPAGMEVNTVSRRRRSDCSEEIVFMNESVVFGGSI